MKALALPVSDILSKKVSVNLRSTNNDYIKSTLWSLVFFTTSAVEQYLDE